MTAKPPGDDQPAEVGCHAAAATPARESRDEQGTTIDVGQGSPRQRLGLGAVLVAVGGMALFAATISHALTAAHNRLRAGEFIAVLTAATVLVVAGAAYEFSRERTRLRAAEDRMKRRDQAKADECRRCHEARLAESNRSARL